MPCLLLLYQLQRQGTKTRQTARKSTGGKAPRLPVPVYEMDKNETTTTVSTLKPGVSLIFIQLALILSCQVPNLTTQQLSFE